MKTSKNWLASGAAVLIAGAMACGGDEKNEDPNPTTGSQTFELSGDITESATWKANNEYILTGLTYVRAPAVLTIEAGTTIKGDTGSALVITKGAKLFTQGTREAPVVFTSATPVGNRRAGDWGGVVLLGAAPINVQGGTNQIEGIDASEARGSYGGADEAHDCGTLRYTRIEFGGFELSTDNELNGLTLGGCGSSTLLDHVQVHMGKDDGVEFFGGSANAKYLVVTQAEDDSVDWDFGYSGKIQFLLVQQNPAEADSGFEADSNKDDNDAAPRSRPTIYNATLIGTNAPNGTQVGMVLRRGTWGTLRNFIVMGFPAAGVDIRDAATARGMTQSPAGLVIENFIFWQNGKDVDDDASADDDGGFDEAAFIAAEARGNRMNTNPMLAGPYDRAAPGWMPAAGSPAATGAATPPDDGFFDTSATFVGGMKAGEDWTAGWTAYPAN